MAATKNVEVELRGRLSTQYVEALRRRARDWQFKGRMDRYLVNLTSPELEAKSLDVRARVTDGKPELVVKKGSWAGGPRIEYSVNCAKGEFEPLLRALVALGFTKGIGARRIIERYMVNSEIEFSIVEVPGYTYFYEAEIMTVESRAQATEARLMRWLDTEGLSYFRGTEFLEFISELDANANAELDFGSESAWELLPSLLE